MNSASIDNSAEHITTNFLPPNQRFLHYNIMSDSFNNPYTLVAEPVATDDISANDEAISRIDSCISYLKGMTLTAEEIFKVINTLNESRSLLEKSNGYFKPGFGQSNTLGYEAKEKANSSSVKSFTELREWSQKMRRAVVAFDDFLTGNAQG